MTLNINDKKIYHVANYYDSSTAINVCTTYFLVTQIIYQTRSNLKESLTHF